MGKEKKEKPRKSSEKQSQTEQKTYSIFFVSIVLVCISLISVVFLLTNEYTKILNEQVENNATYNSAKVLEGLSSKIDDILDRSKNSAYKIAVKQDQGSFEIECNIASNATNVKKIVICKDGELKGIGSESFDSPDKDKIIASTKKEDTDACIVGIITDRSKVSEPMELIAVSVPVSDCNYADAIIVLYDMNSVKNTSKLVSEEVMSQAEFIALSKYEGSSVETIYEKNHLMDPNVNLVEKLKDMSGAKENADTLRLKIESENGGVFLLSIDGLSYAIAVAKDTRFSQICIVSFYNAEDVYSTGYNFIGTIFTSIAILLLFLALFAIYFIISKKSINKKITSFGTTNAQLKCLSLMGFEREATKSVDMYRTSKFAVISAGIRRFDYIAEVGGQENTTELLRNIRNILSDSTGIGETYCYDAQGIFYILLQYGQYDALLRRLSQFYRFVNALSNSRYNVKLNFGIYTIATAEKGKMSQYVANAKTALENSGIEKLDGNYTLYDESLRDRYLKISDMEIKMDNGIKNNEFRVFYQPKYNVNLQRLDGCEALIRWYDEKTDTYRPPDTFIPLLEANGYVSRLDHHVFEQVCKFVNACVAKGSPVVPVSVNVSRMTMLEPDFVEFYAKMKEQYHIPNKFITLEFTESAAYENNDALSMFAKALHEHGFECSIDDFGTGYSSYNLLKSLDVDEVKLDKFFIEGCLTSKRAKYILEGAIAICNNLKIKVTQEGVEDLATFNYLKTIGCNVIQGFYYSQPLSERDFLEFLKTHIRIPGGSTNTELENK